MAQLAADLARLLEHLGVASAAVLGYSQGGAIAQQLVLDHPARWRRLVLVGTCAFNMATFRERVEGHVTPLLLRVLGMRRFAKLVEIRCPTLVVAAEKDEAVPLHHAKALHEGIARSRLVVIDGADHALALTKPDELVKVVDEFLAA